jgi:hypothetical protein
MLYEDIGQSGGGQFERLLRSDNILTDLYHSVLQIAPTEASDCFWREVGPVTTTIPREVHDC